MRIATIMSIAVLGLAGAAIAQVASTPDQDDTPTMQNDIDNDMAAPDDMNAMMDNGADAMDPSVPDTMPPATAPFPDSAPATPDDSGTTI